MGLVENQRACFLRQCACYARPADVHRRKGWPPNAARGVRRRSAAMRARSRLDRLHPSGRKPPRCGYLPMATNSRTEIGKGMSSSCVTAPMWRASSRRGQARIARPAKQHLAADRCQSAEQRADERGTCRIRSARSARRDSLARCRRKTLDRAGTGVPGYSTVRSRTTNAALMRTA